MGDNAEPTPAAAGDAPVAAVGDDAQPDLSAIVAELDAADAAQPVETATSELPTPAPVVKPPEAAKPKDEVTTARARRMLAEAERKERGAALSLAQFKQQLAAKIRDNPDAGLSELGLDTDTLIDAKVHGAGGAKPKTVEEQLAELKTELADAKREREVAALTTQVETAKTQTREKLAALGEKFPRLNCANAEKAAQRRDVAIDFMIEYHAKHGVPLPVETAARMTNDFFDDGGGEAPRAAAPSATAPAAAPRAVAPTLANTGGGSGGAPAADEALDEDALYERALAEINRM
jgi:hypothetical protein